MKRSNKVGFWKQNRIMKIYRLASKGDIGKMLLERLI